MKVAPKQMVPVAPRTRTSHDEALLEVIHVQNRLPKVNSQKLEEEPKEPTLGRVPGNIDNAALSIFPENREIFFFSPETHVRLMDLLPSRHSTNFFSSFA